MAASICCDTSFLFSLYTNDIHSPAALLALARAQNPVVISALNDFEFQYSVQLAVFRGLILPSVAGAAIARFKADVSAGKFGVANCDLADVVTEANRLASRHTPVNGTRSFDILHVAVALCLGAGAFLTFDLKQRALAAAEALAVQP